MSESIYRYFIVMFISSERMIYFDHPILAGEGSQPLNQNIKVVVKICKINLRGEILFLIQFMVLLQNPFQFVQEYLELTSYVFYLGADGLSFSLLTLRSYSTKNTSVVPANVRTKNEF